MHFEAGDRFSDNTASAERHTRGKSSSNDPDPAGETPLYL